MDTPPPATPRPENVIHARTTRLATTVTAVSKDITEIRCLEVKSAADRVDAPTPSLRATLTRPSAHSSPAATTLCATVIPDTLGRNVTFAMTTILETQTSLVELANSANATTTSTWAVLETVTLGQENVFSACTRPMAIIASTAKMVTTETLCDKIAEVGWAEFSIYHE